jgi:hypothetical protein
MAAAKKAADSKKAEPRKKPEAAKDVTRVVTYLAPGKVVDPLEGNTPLLDPELEKARDEEAKANAEVKVEPRGDITIDPELVKARDAQVKRETERAQNQK